MPDFIQGGQAHGSMAAMLLKNNFDIGALRPFVGDDERSYVTQNGVAVPTNNAVATLRKDEWIELDRVIVKAAKQRLKAVADLKSDGLQLTIKNGMGKTILQTETQGDINEATTSMDGLRESQRDRPEFNLLSLPLPIIHKDFSFSARQLAASRSGGSPLDTTTAELAARRVAEEVEKLLLGVSSSYTFGGGTIYGYTNFNNRNTKSLTAPTASGWTGATIVAEVLAMRKQAQDDYHYGPYMVYTSPDWDEYLDADYSTSKGDNTVRDRILKIRGIRDVRTLDYLTGWTLLLIQMTQDVVRMVQGMDVTTVQWESQGGMQLNFKVMTIQVPQIRADFNNNCGIVHGS